jgi:hypothetical protein
LVVRYKKHIFALSIIKTNNIMKKNTAILNTITKLITFNYNGEEFTVDLKEGDLEDSWNSIVTKDDVLWDFNFSWETGEKPCMSIYSLEFVDGNYQKDYRNDTSVKIVEIIGDQNQYFNDKPFEFNPSLKHTFEVFNGEGVLQLKTKKFNLACDTAGSAEYEKKGKGWYVEAIDSNGARKNLG